MNLQAQRVMAGSTNRDGKVLATDLRGPKIKEAVASALGK